jgi:hypothetical protein
MANGIKVGNTQAFRSLPLDSIGLEFYGNGQHSHVSVRHKDDVNANLIIGVVVCP